MRKRLAIAVAVLVFAALVATVWHSQPPREPVYQGRPLSGWLNDYMVAEIQSEDPAAQSDARTALWEIGTNAIPFLLDMLRRPDDSRVHLLLLRVESLIYRRHMPIAEEVRDEGIAGFDVLCAEASNAVPALIQIHQEGPIFRVPAARCLRAIGPPAADSIPILLPDITNAAPELRLISIRALGEIHSRPEIVIPALTNALVHEPVPGFWLGYFDAICAFGPDAKPAAPVLRTFLNAPTNGLPAWVDRESQQEAATWVQKIDPQSAAK
jgi:hypothetical protein